VEQRPPVYAVDPVNASFSRMYLYAYFWSTLAMTTIADLPLPITDAELIDSLIDLLID